MKRLLLFAISVSFLTACTTVPRSRNLALQTVEELRPLGDVPRLRQSYLNLRETLSTGETLAGVDGEEAEKYYRLVLLKGDMLRRDASEIKAQPVVPGPAAAPLPSPSPPTTPAPPAPAPDMRPPIAFGDGTVQPLRPAPEPPPPEEGEEVLFPAVGTIVGADRTYTVHRGDTLQAISSRFGASITSLCRSNAISATTLLTAGATIRIPARRILPKSMRDGIVINIPEKTLYLFRGGSVSLTAPVSVGRPKGKPGESWQTPTGNFTVVAKLKDPVWNVPRSIREEMEKNGKQPELEVPPGPENPLGRYALRTSIPGIFIHGTNAPASIYRFSSHGCIRVGPESMEKLFRAVAVKARGEILYAPVKVASSDDGRVFVEVHGDVYGRVGSLEQEARRVITRLKLEEAVDWEKLAAVVAEKTGSVEEVSR